MEEGSVDDHANAPDATLSKDCCQSVTGMGTARSVCADPGEKHPPLALRVAMPNGERCANLISNRYEIVRFATDFFSPD